MRRRTYLYGRRIGKPLSPRRAKLMATVFQTLAIDLRVPPPQPLTRLFVNPVDDVRLEIGFGAGEHLVACATRLPASGFVGVEPFVEGMAATVAAIDLAGHGNIRLFNGDAADVLEWVPAASLAEIDMLFPDPWPKRRHWKRRFVNSTNLDRIARTLKPGGIFRFASDSEDYVAWTLRHLLARADFGWTAECADDWRQPFPDWPGTRYEAKARRAGRLPTFLTFDRKDDAAR
ncbi:MAG: tRNA (guanosine(46)-N7)-methyltransferase TrmB [Hyphomicrobiales bacterium]|nr:tRNA (guanosine(46)-N7)-methyltransferase TrmB [Hyphomicrobiales bacterium]